MMKVNFTKASKALLAFLVLGVVSSCTPQEVETPASVLREGTVKIVKANSEHFHLELVKLDNQIVVWENRWDGRMVFRQKLFQNIFPVWREEENFIYYNQFEPEALAPLFPLAVGNEVAFTGVQFRGDQEEGAPFLAVISVTGEDNITLQDQNYDVLKIEVVFESQTRDAVERNSITYWHAKELGINLKAIFKFDGGKVATRVVKLEIPEGLIDEPENVGTTLINFEPKEQEPDQIQVLNEAQF